MTRKVAAPIARGAYTGGWRPGTIVTMRIALVSPYSWTYPGGVTRHIEALAEQFIADGHFVRVLAPFDPPDRLATTLHRGATPAPGPPLAPGRAAPGPATELHLDLRGHSYFADILYSSRESNQAAPLWTLN